MANISQRWSDLSGASNWQGLLCPTDNDLRSYLIHYLLVVQAIYNGYTGGGVRNFGLNPNTNRDSYSQKNGGLGLGENIYQYYQAPTKVYASSIFLGPAVGDSQWLGIVTAANDEGVSVLGRRDILVAFRGTMTPAEWGIDDDALFVSPSPILGDVKSALVHSGFYKYYTSSDPMSQTSKTSLRDQVLSAVKALVNQYKDEQMSITVAGHSMGASVAVLCATDIARNGYNSPDNTTSSLNIPVTAFPFACPHVGNTGFATLVNSLNPTLRILRVTNRPDPVPTVPPASLGYVDVGQNLEINTSPLPSPPYDISAHMPSVYIRGILTTQGTGSSTGGSASVLTKNHFDDLDEKYLIDTYELKEKEKVMVQKGSWELKDREADKPSEFAVEDDDGDHAKASMIASRD